MRPRYLPTNLLLAATLTLGAAQANALTELSDDSLSQVQGAGLAFALDNFSMRFAPTSFIELTGTEAQGSGWERGDARYYGLSITNGEQTSGTDWFGNGCNTGGVAGALGCPLGNANVSTAGETANGFGVGALASVYDPYVLRVFEYEGYDFQGDYLDDAERPTILELIGPSNTEKWRWSFWGEFEVDRGNNNPALGACNGAGSSGSGCTNANGAADFLQSQTIIRGKPTTLGSRWKGLDASGNDLGYEAADRNPAILRLMQTADTEANKTLGITYQSALSGNFRFSVRQKLNSLDALHWVPDFQDGEGLYFKNVDAFLPLGTLHYQAITLDALRDEDGVADGNFVIELTGIPMIPEVYNNFYCGDVRNTGNCELNSADGSIKKPNSATGGYVRWGDFTDVDVATGTGLPAGDATDNGVYFVGGTGGCNATTTCNRADVTNLGISRLEGMRIQHLKITTLGAN